MKKLLAGVTLAALTAAPLMAAAQAEGNLMVRGRALFLSADNSNDPAFSGGKFEVNDKLFPEVDITYFITKNLATELVLTYPQKHDVKLGGSNIGTVKHLPPTLSLQWHFLPDGQFRPYVGVGLNYTMFSSVKLSIAGADIDRNSFGLAYGAGLDIKVAPKLFLNFDAKYVNIETDVKLNGTKLTTLGINPWLFSVGLGYRF